jgi:hypothetical protein
MRLSVSAPVPKRCEKIALVVRPVGAAKPGITKLEERAPNPHDAQPLVKQVAKRDARVHPSVPFLNALSNRLDSRYAAKIGGLVDDPLHWSALASLPGQGGVAQEDGRLEHQPPVIFNPAPRRAPGSRPSP